MGTVSNEVLGWVAVSLVFATFCARRMVPLRLLAIASNVAFISYGYADRLWPIVILHMAMLPMNAVRLRQALIAMRAEAGPQAGAPHAPAHEAPPRAGRAWVYRMIAYPLAVLGLSFLANALFPDG